MLLTARAALSIDWPDGNAGRYYWQHCFWVDRSDFSSDLAMGLACIGDMKLLYTHQVRIHGIRWYDPSDGAVYFEQVYLLPQFGDQPDQDNYNILICARWHMYGSDGSYTYHLHRQPVGEAYLDSGEWSSLGRTQCLTRLSTFGSQGIYRTRTGALITSWQLGASPVQWQLRHGTKRRERRAWL